MDEPSILPCCKPNQNKKSTKNILFKRLPCIAVAVLLLLASIAQIWSAITCDFVLVTSKTKNKPLQLLVNTTSNDNFLVINADTSKTYLGLFCPNEYYTPDIKWKTSRIFLLLSCIFGMFSLIYSLKFTFCKKPNAFTWQVLSIGVAITAVLIVPSFLIFDSTPCQIINQVCTVNLGSFLLVVSCSLYISVVVITQCVDAPSWMLDKEDKKKGEDGVMEAYYTDNSIDDPNTSYDSHPNNISSTMNDSKDKSRDEESSNCYNYHSQEYKIKKKKSPKAKKSSVFSTASWNSFVDIFPKRKSNTKLADMHDEPSSEEEGSVENISDTVNESFFSVGNTGVIGSTPKKNTASSLSAQPSMASSVGGEWRELWKPAGSYVSVEGGAVTTSDSSNNKNVDKPIPSSPQPSYASPPIKEISVVTSNQQPQASATQEQQKDEEYPIHISFTKNDIPTGYSISPTLQRRLARHQGAVQQDKPQGDHITINTSPALANLFEEKKIPKKPTTIEIQEAPMDEEESYQSNIQQPPKPIKKVSSSQRSVATKHSVTSSYSEYSLPPSETNSTTNLNDLRNKTSMIVSSSEDEKNSSPDDDTEDDSEFVKQQKESIMRKDSNNISQDESSIFSGTACSNNEKQEQKERESSETSSATSAASEWSERFVPTVAPSKGKYKQRDTRTSLSPILQHSSKDETESSDNNDHNSVITNQSSQKSIMSDLLAQHRVLKEQFQVHDQGQQPQIHVLSDEESAFYRELENEDAADTVEQTQAKKIKKSPRSDNTNENVKAPPSSAFLRSSPTNDFVWTKHVCGSQQPEQKFPPPGTTSDSSNCSSGQETVATSNSSSTIPAPKEPKSYNTTLPADAFSPQGYVAMITSSSDDEEDNEEEQDQVGIKLQQAQKSSKLREEINSSSSDSDATTCISNVSTKATSPRRRQHYQSTDYTMLPNTFADDAPPKQRQHLPPKPRYPPKINPLPPVIQTRYYDSRSSPSSTPIKINKPNKYYNIPHTHTKAFEIVRRNNLRFECTQNSSSDDDVLTQIARETRRMRLQRRYNSVSPSRSVSNQYRFQKTDDPVPNATTVSSESDTSDDTSSSSSSFDGSHVSSTASSQHDSQASIRDARIQRLRNQFGVDGKAQQTAKPTVTFIDGEIVHESHGTNTNTTESILRQRWFYSQK